MTHFLSRKLKYVCALVMSLSFIMTSALAQSVTVTGKVINDKAEPLPNVSVLVKGTSNGVTTNEQGEFSINVPNNKSALVISSVGYQTQTITVGTQRKFDIVMIAGEASQLESVVVVGYATQKKVTVTGAVAQVKGSELDKSPSINLSNSLAGRLPGITAVQRSGEPGYMMAHLYVYAE